MQIEKVWENASPTSIFAAQKLNIAEVTANTPIIIEHITAGESSLLETTTEIVFPQDVSGTSIRYALTFAGFISSSSQANRGVSAKRGFDINDGEINFRDATKTRVPNGTNPDTVTDNDNIVPYRIYILKLPE